MPIKFSDLPAKEGIIPAHTECWVGMISLFFADPCRIGRRLPDVLGNDDKPITGPWRYRDYKEATKCTVTVHQQATANIMAMHLSGRLEHGNQRAWLQCYAASDEGVAVYSTVDLDVEGVAHSAAPEHFASQDEALEAAKKLIAEAETLGLVAHLEITKSGGYRVWVFHHRLRAAHARDLGRLLVARAALHAKTEVFPAQSYLMDGQYGSAVFTPYNWHNARDGRQVMIDPETGGVRMVEKFVQDAIAHRSAPALVERIVSEATETGELKASAPPRERAEYDGENRLAQDPSLSASAWNYQALKCMALGDIVRRCEEGVQISRADWFRLATHLRAFGEWGYGEFHRLSETDGRYNEGEADALWDSIHGGPVRCSGMECGRDPQADCGIADGKVSAVWFAYQRLRQLPVANVRPLRNKETKMTEMHEKEMSPEDKEINLSLARLDRTDLGNTRRMLARYGDVMRYSAPEKTWYVWDGRLWIKHTNANTVPMLRAAETMLLVKQEADMISDDAEAAAHRKHAIRSQSRERIGAALSLLSIMPELTASPADFDVDPELVSVENGTLDLRAQTLMPHRAEDMISAMMPVTFDPEAKCPHWDQFMFDVVPDPAMRQHLKKWCGYNLTGLTKVQAFLFLFGAGQNGKSTFLNVIREMMGPVLHSTVASNTLMLDPSGGKNMALAMVPFVTPRSVTMTEGAEGSRFDEELIKSITGGDELKARRHYELEFGFVPKLKLTIAANHKPKITGTDKGIWRRVQLVPFDAVITKPDPELPAKLRAELPGILNWMLAGLADYYREGFETPQAILDATQQYREDSDVLGEFLDEMCMVKADAKTPGSDLYNAYKTWTLDNGHKPLANNTFANRLSDRGFRRGEGRLRRTWYGLWVRELFESVEEDAKAVRETKGFSPAPKMMRDLDPSLKNASPSPESGAFGDDCYENFAADTAEDDLVTPW